VKVANDFEKYRFILPEDLIAKEPVEPRDSCRLFVFDTASNKINIDYFNNLDEHLPGNSLLVLNDTKVVPARIVLQKEHNGGKVEVLFLVNEWKDENQPINILVDRKITVSDILYFGGTKDFKFEVVSQQQNIFSVRPLFAPKDVWSLLDKYGVMPVPKYIKGGALNESSLRENYQTIFATAHSSVAAPTASLHFTENTLKKLEKKGIDKTFVTLRIGMGTFAPLSSENILQNKLHSELYDISYETALRIKNCKDKKRSIIAVGTTVVRTLESVSNRLLEENLKNDIAGETNIFIHAPFDFKVADILITNFHLPNSSLMMLVEAFLQSKSSERSLRELYEFAIKEKFRFYSFGDAMLIK
jgi:S-adenosylmethionine:tRNA ribosyltransferase-isomerase